MRGYGCGFMNLMMIKDQMGSQPLMVVAAP